MASGHSNKLSCIESIDLFKLKPVVSCIRLVIAGGLIAGNSLPVYADLPVPSPNFVASGSVLPPQVTGDTMLIKQETDKAILNWQSFNVGAKNTVQFVQPGSSSIALNRIHQADPSQIFGQIKANGQIYLYNQNGFVFGKDSVVNANSVLASTLNITDEVFTSGITRVFDDGGKAALAIEPQEPGSSLDPKNAAILIEAGAKIHVEKNGRIIISAPTIENKGSLSADEQGQIIMVASQDKVYLQPAKEDSPFAGLLVEVDTGGKVTNAGDILVRQGNATLAGFAVNQTGRITATTSVSINGSIRLIAQEQHGTKGNTLVGTKTTRDSDLNDGLGQKAKTVLATGSVTEIVADKDGGTAIDEQDQAVSYMQASGHTVQVQSGASVYVPGGKVNLTATDNLADPTQGTKGRILLEKGSLIDVSGYKDVEVPMERNVGEISVQSYELRDAPLQRSGVLKGETIRVDLRKDTSIVDTSGAEARIERGVKERLGKGGEINLTASGDAVINDGATLNIAGGSVNYLDGYISTTKLLTDYGRIVDISDADPNARYVSVFGVVKEVHQKWGVEKIWNTLDSFGRGKFEQGYTEGKDAGSLNIKAPNVAWSGDLVAGSSAGRYQRELGSMPFGGRFDIDTAVFQSFQNVRFQTEGAQLDLAVDQDFPVNTANQPVDLILAADVFAKSGVGQVSVKTLGDVTLDENTTITMKPSGILNVEAGNIAIDGGFKAAGGTVDLKAAISAQASNAGRIELGEHATLDVSGSWVNDLQRGFSASPTDPLAIAGGSVKLRAEDDLVVNAGSTIRADGGAWLQTSGDLKAGKGGDITLAAIGDGASGSLLTLDGEVSAYGLERNGSLTLVSGKIVVGGNEPPDPEALVLGVSNGNFNFSQNLAFNEINLFANFGDLTIKSDVNLDLRAHNWQLKADALNTPTGGSLRDLAQIVELPEHLRQPLKINIAGLTGVNMQAGSILKADKGSSINVLSNVGSIFVDGELQAPSGEIDLSIKPPSGLEYDAKQSIWIGEHARLLAEGTTRLNPTDILGHRSGSVLDGGEINIDAQRGTVVLEQGSVLDVSGTHGTLDVLQSTNSIGGSYAAKTIGSNAGAIKLTAAEGIVMDGVVRGNAGSGSAHGGKLEVTLDRSNRNPPDVPKIPFPNTPLVINVTQASRRSLDEEVNFGEDFPSELNGQATISADAVRTGGFADLSLNSRDRVEFVGDVNLATAERLRIDAPLISAVGPDGTDAGNINLETGILQIGSSFNRNLDATATVGSGQFSVHSQWMQLTGATRWDGFARISLNSDHDLRTIGLRNEDDQRDYIGGLVTAADLHLHASQIYPSTLTDFTFAVKNNPNGQIIITGSNTDVTPLSAAGSLTFEAPVINQQGVLKAPIGTINLKAGSSLTLGDGSVTSVSAENQVIPFGVTQGGLDWLYPLDSLRNLVFDVPPEKRLVLSAPEIDIKQGSVVDVSGGGDLVSYEFQPGAGGSYDYLQPGSSSYQGGFAVIPKLGSLLAPFDHFQSQGFAYAPGDTVYLSGSGDLPAGEYAILPAHYALLPGAFLITPQANTDDLAVSQFTVDGRAIVPGYEKLAGTSIRDARSGGYLIESSEQVRQHSEYDIKTANQFYAQRALKNEKAVPLLLADAGQISLIAQTKLIIEGDFMVDALSGGRGAKLDIAADRINVVAQLSQTPADGTLEILADDLSALNVGSLLLGGARSSNKVNSDETDIDVTAREVVFAADVKYQGSEIIAAATDLIDVQAGASLDADRQAGSGDSVLNVKGDGALLRLSGDKQVILNRTYTPGVKGDLLIAAGSTLKATKSMLLDASQSTQILGDIQMQGGSLNLAANTINMGEVANLADDALNLSNLRLANLAVDELVLTGRDSIGVYGNVGRVNADGLLLNDNNGSPLPIQFERLVINTAGLTGHGSAADTARLQAGTLEIQNTAAATNHQVVDGQGQLDLLADSVKIGNGNFAIQGFTAVNINAGNEFRAVGKGSLDVAADLNLSTAAVTADGGSNLNLNAGGYHAQFNSLNSTTSVDGGFGGVIEVIADTIAFNTKAVLPSGSFGLHALNGDVAMGGQSHIDLAGRAVQFADQTGYTSGGHFKAMADHGKIVMATESLIDIDSGGGKAAGGSLTLQAPDQSVALLGQLQATGGSATLDVGSFDATADFNALMRALNDAGISQSLYFRVRNADIVQSASSDINARSVTLVTDQGGMSLAGGVHADAAEQGGSIKLYAGDNIVLANGATLTATGTGEGAKGGQVLLSSVDDDNDGLSGIDIQNGSKISVAGNGGEGGEVTLRALRTDSGVNIKLVAGSANGYSKFYAEGVKKYGNADLGNDNQINAADINKIKSETAAYMTEANMQNVSNLAAGMRLTAGIEINYTGNLTLKDNWDLVAWRYDDVADSNIWDDLPGRLVINTSGNFNVEKSLSDGFKTQSFAYPGATAGSTTSINIVDKLQDGESWSYNLVAGADTSSADINASTQSGNLVIGSNTVIRTGSGDMQLTAGGDITFTSASSSVYNAGRPAETSPYGALKDRFVGQLFYSEYPVEGGDLTLAAGGDINGAAAANNDLNDWLLRIGNWTDSANHTGQRPTAWGVALGYITTSNSTNPAKSTKPFFQQNVGSFGGGNVSVSAGGNINNLDVMMPTTGKQVGTPDNSSPGSLNFLSNQVEVNGGGNMQINAGGNIAGGTYYLGKGTGTMTAGGEITGGSKFTKGPDLLIGDTQFSINAGSGISLTGVSDPMILHKSDVNFFSYSANSTLNVASLSGDVLLGADGSSFPRSNPNSNQQNLARIYPASLNASAFGGNIKLIDEIILFPSAEAQLNLFAEQNITAAIGVRLGMSDADRSLLPYPEATLSRSNMSTAIARIDPFGGQPNLLHATVPVHRGDSQPVRLVTRKGDIENIGFSLAKKALVKSGHDIVNLSLSVQHVNDGDVSLVEALRDLRYTSDRDPATGALIGNSAKIEIGGPGEVLIKTGRHVDLGASDGISTVGNVVNANLAEQGANLTILTGANGELDYAGFIAAYLQGSDLYKDASQKIKTLITDFMRERLNDGTLSETAALEAFAELKSGDFVAIQPQLNAIILPVFFNEIKESGAASAGTDSLGNERGYAAIESLFPGSEWKGDLSMFFSKIHTLDSGDINLLVPGGQINTGLAVSFTGAKPASELGVVVQRQGNINAFAHDDFLVNSSRVFALDGGDIMIWSSEGDIDAGRGAKSAIAAPPPVVSFDDKGNLKIEFPPIVSGSGIRTAASSTGVLPGDVFLFAPKGVVNAGEAGIGGTNVTISATAVLGANNIQVSGIGTGVPAASTGSLAAGLTGTSNLTASVSQVAQAATGVDNDDTTEKAQNAALGMLSVDVIGIGDSDPEEKNSPQQKRSSRSTS